MRYEEDYDRAVAAFNRIADAFENCINNNKNPFDYESDD